VLDEAADIARQQTAGQYRNFRVWVGRLILFRPWLG
jgi:hypothetical protein